MSKHYPVEQRERAVKMVLDHLGECRSVYAAAQAIGPKVGVGPETVYLFVHRSDACTKIPGRVDLPRAHRAGRGSRRTHVQELEEGRAVIAPSPMPASPTHCWPRWTPRRVCTGGGI